MQRCMKAMSGWLTATGTLSIPCFPSSAHTLLSRPTVQSNKAGQTLPPDFSYLFTQLLREKCTRYLRCCWCCILNFWESKKSINPERSSSPLEQVYPDQTYLSCPHDTMLQMCQGQLLNHLTVNYCKFLKYLTIIYCKLFKHLTDIYCKFLKNLTVIYCQYLKHKALFSCTFLKQLTTIYCKLLKHLTVIQYKFLKHLTVIYCRFFKQLTVISCNFLKYLTVIYCKFLKHFTIIYCK